MLSIGIMMKNEEKYIGKCLGALIPILERIEAEIIVVDTGSTDKSVEIAKQYTDKVYLHKWNNNFSEMRNKVISYCKGDWFLSVDADEILEEPDSIVEFFLSGEQEYYNGATVKIKSFTNSKLTKYSVNDLNRIFRLDKDFKYNSTIHEQPEFRNPTKVLLATFQHFGYLNDDKELMERKFQRNKELILKELETDPKNIYMNFQLAVTYNMHGDIKESVDILKKTYERMSRNEKSLYKQVSIEYSNSLLVNNRVSDCIKVCKEALGLHKGKHQYKIDLAYNLAYSNLYEKRYHEAIANYKLYLTILNDWEEGALLADNTITSYKVCSKDKAYKELSMAQFEVEDFEAMFKSLENIEDSNELYQVINLAIKAYIKEKKYIGLLEYYTKNVLKAKDKDKLLFMNHLEEQHIKMDKSESAIIRELFTKDESIYGKFNMFLMDNPSRENLESIIEGIVEFDNKEYYMGFFGEVLDVALKYEYDIAEIFGKLSCKVLIEFIDYCCDKKDNKDILKLIIKYIENNQKSEFIDVKIKMMFCKCLLILEEMDKQDEGNIFDKYINYGNQYIRSVYSDFILNNKLICELKDAEHKFFMIINDAMEIKNTDRKKYLRYIKNALKIYPVMKDGIKNLLEECEKEYDTGKSEMDSLKDMLIKNIETLIDSNKINEAKEIIKQFRMIAGEDERIEKLELRLV